MFGAILFLACALSAHRTGLIAAGEDEVVLTEAAGRAVRIRARGSAAPLAHLDGCVVEVRGPRLGARLYPRRWTVLDAGDGWPPFVGILRRYGGNWVIDDRMTGRVVVLSPLSVPQISEAEGHLVLISGVVDGPEQVRVMRWRRLD